MVKSKKTRPSPCGTKSPYTYKPPFYGVCLKLPYHDGRHETMVEVRLPNGKVTVELYRW